MPTKNPRVNITFEESTAKLLSALAKGNHKSMSGMAKELILEALAMREDVALSNIADIRDQENIKTVKHEDAWK